LNGDLEGVVVVLGELVGGLCAFDHGLDRVLLSALDLDGGGVDVSPPNPCSR
jgi:hypothetical protein